MTANIFKRVLAALIIAGLAACGGGGSGGLLSGVGSGGTGITAGTVTGFGSVIIDGTRYLDTTAIYDITSDTSAAAVISPTLAKIGQQAEVATDTNGNATAVHIYPEVVGLVTSISASTNTITVAGTPGTRVVANASNGALPITVYGGYTQFSNISIGDRVEVHGLPMTDSNGAYVAASRIDLKPSICTGGCAVRVTGTLSNLNTVAQTFTLNGLTVNYSGSTTITPSGQSLANGERVSVFSATPLSGNTLTASAIIIRKLSTSASTLRLSGAISNYTSNASFTVAGVTVTAASATLTPTSLVLANGVNVTAGGNYDPLAGKLVATSVSQYGSSPILSELHGNITNFVSASNFQVRGTLVNAATATFSPPGSTSANLQNNVYVEIFGSVSNNIVNAATVAFQTAATDSDGDLSGVVSGYLSPTQAFTITLDNSGTPSTTIQAILTASPFFIGCTTSPCTDLANTVHVSVHGVLQANGVWLANTVTFLLGTQQAENDNGSNGTKEVQGIVSNLTGNTFSLNGITVNYSGSTTISGGTLSNGVQAQVYGTLITTPNGSTMTVSKIEIDNDH